MVVAQGTPCTGGRIFPTAACNVLERLCADANDLNLVEDGAVWTEAVATYGEARQPATGAICIFFKVCCLALQHTARLCNMLLGFAWLCNMMFILQLLDASNAMQVSQRLNAFPACSQC